MNHEFILILTLSIVASKFSNPFSFKVSRTSFSKTKFATVTSQPRHSTTLKSTSSSNDEGTLRDLYPPPRCFNNGSLPVDDIHTIFFSEYGEGRKFTALYLHGGPGAGSFPNHARFFDPKYFRVVLFDQRGCGKSTPRGETRNNTLQHLVQDCQTVMNHLKITKWDIVVGGSFGVALALAYAATFPESVGSLVLRGICLMRPKEIDYLFGDFGSGSRLNPNAWNSFSSFVESDLDSFDDNDDYRSIGRKVLAAYYYRLLGNDPRTRLLATKYWTDYEMKMNSITNVLNANEEAIDGNKPSSLSWDGFYWKFKYYGHTSDYMTSTVDGKDVNTTGDELVNSFRRFSSLQTMDIAKIIQKNDTSQKVNESQFFSQFNESQISSFIPAQAMLTCYYSYNDSFLNDESLLDIKRINSIRNIPCIAIQGGMDFICPPDTMLDLHEMWPEMIVRLVLKGGHSVYDPLIKNEVINACDYFKNQLLMSYAEVNT